MKTKLYLLLVVAVAVATFGVTALLMNIAERKRQATDFPLRVVEIGPDEVDPAVWGLNHPHQYDSFMRTKENYGRTKYGGSEPYDKLEKYPQLKRLWAGLAFSVDYKEERGHYWALTDVLETKRVQVVNQPTTCFACKSADVPRLMREMGVAEFYRQPFHEMRDTFHHSISCSDCHDPRTMNLRITRPAFTEAMQMMGVDISRADRQQMRSYVCAQCHVEYYFKGEDKYLVFPWSKGLKIENIEEHFDSYNFHDWIHAETRAKMIKIQHPEFEMWSQGIHARSGVSCADCHMPYKRVGAVKISDHWMRSPLTNLAQSCLSCHSGVTEQEMTDRVHTIQDRTYALMQRAEAALLGCIDAIVAAMRAGATDEQLEQARRLHRRAQMRWDFVNAENSMGFHAPQESARILGEAIDYARQAQLSALTIVAASPSRPATD
jgi:nitrite reductase (cytochrome c-552)